MIRKITLLAFLAISAFSFAQFRQGSVGHLTIFSEDGDKFFLILNGEAQNDIPQTNLRIEDLNQPYYNAKIQFEDKSLLDISKNNLKHHLYLKKQQNEQNILFGFVRYVPKNHQILT